MEIEKIIIVEFDSISNALGYLEDSGNYFSFKVGDLIYSELGEIISESSEYEVILFGEIWLNDISDNPHSGQLYIDNGFLKYYKENYE
jgi:hypothetical protein